MINKCKLNGLNMKYLALISGWPPLMAKWGWSATLFFFGVGAFLKFVKIRWDNFENLRQKKYM
jgi:hypothetical protein